MLDPLHSLRAPPHNNNNNNNNKLITFFLILQVKLADMDERGARCRCAGGELSCAKCRAATCRNGNMVVKVEVTQMGC